MKRLASKWAGTLGLPGLVGLVLIAAGAILYLSASLPAKEKSDRLSGDIAEARANRGKTPRAGIDENSPEYRLGRFYASFPRREDAPQLLEMIYAAAREENILLKLGEYKFAPGKKLWMYQVSLPVQGSYVGIRKFIARVLNSVPSAALDAVSFTRENVGGIDLDAKIRFTIFMGGMR